MPAFQRVSPSLLPAVSLCYTGTYGAAPSAARAWRKFMPRHLCGHVMPDKHVQGVCTAMGLLLGIMGFLVCLVGCTGSNPLVCARPSDALAWDEARLADSPYFY